MSYALGEELDTFYLNEDPWGFKNNPEDIKRKARILRSIHGRYERALDIGCGEGWITKDLPAKEIHGYELSRLALDRCPDNVYPIITPFGQYDLVLLTGVMYKHYTFKKFLRMVKEHASNTVVTCNIASWEVKDIKTIGKQVFTETFPYRQYQQRLRIFEVTS